MAAGAVLADINMIRQQVSLLVPHTQLLSALAGLERHAAVQIQQQKVLIPTGQVLGVRLLLEAAQGIEEALHHPSRMAVLAAAAVILAASAAQEFQVKAMLAAMQVIRKRVAAAVAALSEPTVSLVLRPVTAALAFNLPLAVPRLTIAVVVEAAVA